MPTPLNSCWDAQRLSSVSHTPPWHLMNFSWCTWSNCKYFATNESAISRPSETRSCGRCTLLSAHTELISKTAKKTSVQGCIGSHQADPFAWQAPRGCATTTVESQGVRKYAVTFFQRPSSWRSSTLSCTKNHRDKRRTSRKRAAAWTCVIHLLSGAWDEESNRQKVDRKRVP